LRIFSVNTALPIEHPIGCPAMSCGSCAPSRYAELRSLGGHKDPCDHCGHVEISYNSCRNRHCPQCQTLRKEKWIEARRQDLLPIEYFHVVFTLSSERNLLVSMNRKVLYDLLFRSVFETLAKLANDPKHLGAGIGGIGILHTWGQNLMDHPHIHWIITGGGLSSDTGRWVSCRKGFFIPLRVMSALVRGKFLDLLKRCFQSDALVFPDSLSHLKDPTEFETFRKNLYPLLHLRHSEVSFLWRDYADHNRQKTMTLKANEFIRRFLVHVLPSRYVRIRHFGLLANRKRKDNIARCRQLLGDAQTATQQNTRKETWQQQLFRICGIDVTLGPVCQKGRMCRIALLLPYRCHNP
jgi:hypothetical protein